MRSITSFNVPTWRKIGSYTAALVGALAFGACADSGSGDDTGGMAAAERDDLAVAVGALVAHPEGGEIDAFGEVFLLADGGMPTGFTSLGAGEVEGDRRGVKYKYKADCKDASGDSVACGEFADSAKIKTEWKGEWKGDGFKYKNEYKGDWRFEQLQSPVVLLNGDSDANVDSDFTGNNGIRRQWKVDYEVSYDDVAIDAATRRVIGGTASYYLKVERKVDAENFSSKTKFKSDADVVFTADSTATLVLDGDYRYRIDLDDGSVVALP